MITNLKNANNKRIINNVFENVLLHLLLFLPSIHLLFQLFRYEHPPSYIFTIYLFHLFASSSYISVIIKSLSKTSLHLFSAFPFLNFCHIFMFLTILTASASSLHKICPNHLNPTSRILSIIGTTPIQSIMNLFLTLSALVYPPSHIIFNKSGIICYRSKKIRIKINLFCQHLTFMFVSKVFNLVFFCLKIC